MDECCSFCSAVSVVLVCFRLLAVVLSVVAAPVIELYFCSLLMSIVCGLAYPCCC